MKDLLEKCKQRVSFGENTFRPLLERLECLSDEQLNHDDKTIAYHSECRKAVVHKKEIQRLQEKWSKQSKGSSVRAQGRPSTSAAASSRPRRVVSTPLEKRCLFRTCDFCPDESDDRLVHVESDAVGESLVNIKNLTCNDQIRVSVSDLHDKRDAFALGKYYHKYCLRQAERSVPKPSAQSGGNDKIIRRICDDQILSFVMNNLSSSKPPLSMGTINRVYANILLEYDESLDGRDYKKHLKALILDNISGISFVLSKRRNEPENIVLNSELSEAVDLRVGSINEDDVGASFRLLTKRMRSELLNLDEWTFEDKLDGFSNPPLVQCFLTSLLFGNGASDLSGSRSDECKKVVNAACQFLVQNTYTERQVNYKTERGFQKHKETPLSLGTALAIHAKVRSKSLVKMLRFAKIGTSYSNIIRTEIGIEQAVLQQMKDGGGYCLPDFIKKNVGVWFAIDNVDFNINTPTGSDTFHGTIIVIFQRDENGVLLNEPLCFTREPGKPLLSLSVSYLPEPTIKLTPIKFTNFELHTRDDRLSQDFTNTWFLSNFLTQVLYY